MFKKWIAVGALLTPHFVSAASFGTYLAQESYDAPGRSPWRAAQVTYDDQGEGFVSKWGGVLSTDERYGSRGTGAQVYAVHEIARGLAVEGRLLGSSGAEFLAKKGAELTLYAGLPAGLELTTTVGRKIYAHDSVSVLRAQLDREFGAWRFGAGISHDVHGDGQVMFGLAKYAAQDWTLGVRLAKGDEAERSAQGLVTLRDIRVAVLEGSYSLRPKTSLRWALTRTLTDASRTGVSLGLVQQF